MTRSALLALAVLLAACAARAPDGAQNGAFRDKATPIWSAAAFAPTRIEGNWEQTASFQPGSGKTCQGGAIRMQPTAGGLRIEGALCLAGKTERIAGLAKLTGPGRLALPGQADWWVLWVDEGYRTMAIGTPDGSFGFVLDRGASATDRLTAAREIFDFNGYDVAAFRAF